MSTSSGPKTRGKRDDHWDSILALFAGDSGRRINASASQLSALGATYLSARMVNDKVTSGTLRRTCTDAELLNGVTMAASALVEWVACELGVPTDEVTQRLSGELMKMAQADAMHNGRAAA